MIEDILQDQIDAAKAQLTALNAAQLGISSGAIESYTLDTGQSKITVTKSSISTLDNAIDSLLNRIATMCARLNGSGTTITRPCW